MGAATQMNTRIEPGLKARGDTALARAGFSPSQAVRALWTLAAGYIDDPDAIQQMLDPDANESARSERAERTAAIERGQHICDEFLSACCKDHDVKTAYSELSFDDLRELAWSERLQERGLA